MPTFGNTATGADNTWAQSQWIACKFTAPAVAGTITKITAYVAGQFNGGDLQAAIYDDNAGAINNLVATGGINAGGVAVAHQWVDSFFVGFNFTPGAVYWLAIGSNVPNGIFDSEAAGAVSQMVYELGNSLAPPTPFDVGGYRDFVMSIYATYTVPSGTHGKGMTKRLILTFA